MGTSTLSKTDHKKNLDASKDTSNLLLKKWIGISFSFSIFLTILASGYVTVTIIQQVEKKILDTYDNAQTEYNIQATESASSSERKTNCETVINQLTAHTLRQKFAVTKAEKVDPGTYDVKFAELSLLPYNKPVPTPLLKCTASLTASSSKQENSQDFFLSPQLKDGRTFMFKQATNGTDIGNLTNNEMNIIGLVPDNSESKPDLLFMDIISGAV